jgi:hypothetical protein
MNKRTAPARKARKPRSAAALGPGLHAGVIELRSQDTFRVRMLDGTVVSARPDDGVDPELLRDCLRNGRRVIVADGGDGPLLLGALQTARPVARDVDGNLTLSGKRVRLKAEQALVLECGEGAVRLDSAGALRLEGDRLVVDIGSLVRFLAARVEFP